MAEIIICEVHFTFSKQTLGETVNNSQKYLIAVIIACLVVVSAVGIYSIENGGHSGELQYISVVSSNGVRQTVDLNYSNSYMITPDNFSGGVYSFNSTITRIVSLAPSITTTLYGIGAIGKVVGIDSFSTYPSNLSLPVMTDDFGMGISIENIENVTPQLVIAPGDGFFPLSEENAIVNTLHIPFLVMNPQNMQQIENQTTELAQITGNSPNATAINNWMQQSLQGFSTHLANITNDLNVFYYLSTPGAWTAGNGTFINQFFTTAHLRNIAGNRTGYYVESSENITVSQPQIIFLDQYVNASSVTVEPFNSTPAVKDNMVFTIFNDNYFSEPDFRVIFAIGWIISKAYPDNYNLSDIPSFPISLQYPPGSGV